MLIRPLFARLPLAAVVLVANLLAADAEGAEAGEDGPVWSINGYGTLGVVHSSDDRADYIPAVLRPDGPGHTRRWSPDVDSRLGIQVSADITPKLTAVLQVLSQQRHDGSYKPTSEWANIKYQFTPAFSVRLGRVLQPTFLFADTRNVAYTYPWVRPPAEMYDLIPVSHNTGVDFYYRLHLGEFTNTLEASFGNRNILTPERLGGGHSEARDTFATMITSERGPTTFRLSYHQTQLAVFSFRPLFDAFRQFGPEGVAIAERYDATDGDRLWFAGVGVNYAPGDYFAIGEWGVADYQNILGKSAAWYISGGRRFDTLTPYATFARLDFLSETSHPGLTLSSLPPPLAGPAVGLNAALNAILGGFRAQRATTLGLRWDFMNNAALKLQYEYVRRDEGSTGTFGNLQPGFEPGGTASVFSASIDFVF